MPLNIKQASLENTHLRMLLAGPSGSGKTLTALKLAYYLGGKTIVIDTERDTAKLFANHAETPKPYDIYNLKKYAPKYYIAVIEEIVNDYDIIIVDSITPSWNKTDGILDIAGGKFGGWRDANPEYYRLMDCLTGYNDRAHFICTVRSKMDYAYKLEPSTGKYEVSKLGLAPVHRDETPYEFDIVGQLDETHTLTFTGVGKSRVDALDGKSFTKPGKDLADILNNWLTGVQTDES